MEQIGVLASNLLSPIILLFVLGIFASLIRSDLKLPAPLYNGLTIYLLLAIGLKGGVELHKTPVSEFIWPALVTLLLGIITPITAYNVLRRLGKFDRINASAIAAHYGSVSAVTFIVAVSFGTMNGLTSEGFMPAMVAILEVPAIVVALMIAFTRDKRAGSWQEALHEVLSGRSIMLLLGGLIIGWISGPEGFEPISPFFETGFKGALALFLLEMGVITAKRLEGLKEVGAFLIAFGIFVPILHGALAIWMGSLAGLSVAGAAVLGAMVSSASYIAAPAAVRIALPEANPTLYLTASLGITFPFNITIGIPIYYAIAEWLM